MNLAIFGTGLVTPIATNAPQHAAFVASGLGLNPASAFLVDDEPLAVRHCPWLGAQVGVRDRQIVLARRALLEGVGGPSGSEIPLLVCTSQDRLGFTAEDRAALLRALDAENEERWARGRFRVRETFLGAAGAFDALAYANELVASGADRVALVAVDSLISLDTIRDLFPTLQAPWTSDVLAPSEGAAATLLGPRGDGQIAEVLFAATKLGQGSDDDDAIVDGAAMTALVRAIPRCAPITRWYGQSQGDQLRRHEWRYAITRNVERAHPDYDGICLEHESGSLGAAAGLAHLVYGVACELHHEPDDDPRPGGPIAAWAISRDGLRGLAALEVSL